ncbi:MAG: single-stranded DNA-binding protein [Rikenellaceae bacterium]
MINRVILQGFVAEDPFVRSTERGMVARIRMATVKYIPSGDERLREVVEWHSVVFWGEQAKIVDEQIRAGMALYIEGELQTRSWEDKSGVKHRTTDIVASQLRLLDGIEGYRLPSSITPTIVERSVEAVKESSKPFSAPADDIDNLPF